MNANLNAPQGRLGEIFGIDLRTLALFRFCLGAVLLWNLLRYLGEADVFWNDWGVLPRSFIIDLTGWDRVSLYFINGSTAFVMLLLGLQCVFALMFMLGWRARTAAIVSFLLWGSLLNRNPIVTIGGDLLISCLLFWSMFLPVSARFSVDAATATNPSPRNNLHLSWASGGLLLQVMSVYFFSAILKSGEQWHPDYTGVYYAMSLDRYATPTGQWLLHFPGLMKALSFFVFWLEALGPILIFLGFRKLRFGLMLAFMLMHIGFIFCLYIGHFPWVSLCSLSTFLGGWVWDAAHRRHQQRHSGALKIYYDRDCGFCLKMCLLFQQFLVLPQAHISPAQDNPRAKALLEANFSWVVIDGDDRAYLKWAAFAVLIRRSPILGWTHKLFSAKKLEAPGNRAYDFVGRNRGAMARISAWLLPQHEVRWETGNIAQRVAAVFIVLIFVWNWTTTSGALGLYFGHAAQIEKLSSRVSSFIAPPLNFLRLDQKWNMFAPRPLLDDGWLVIPGLLADGSEVDVLYGEYQAARYDKESYKQRPHPSIHWHSWLGRMYEKETAQYRLPYAKYLCREWNRDKLFDPDLRAKRLMSFKIIYMLERTLPPGQTPQVEQRIVWRHECFPSKRSASKETFD